MPHLSNFNCVECLQDWSSRSIRQTFQSVLITFAQKGNAAHLHCCLQNYTLAELYMDSNDMLSSMWHVDSSKNTVMGNR